MAQQTLNVGSSANDGTGDTLRVAMDKVNDNFTELYASPLFSGDILVSDNEITAARSNDDLVLSASGTGSVAIANLTIDNNINLTDNEIRTTVSNSDLKLSASGTGSVVIDKASITGGNINNTVIGNATAVAGTFTTLTTTGSLTVDSVTITDNTISTNTSNADLELSGSGTGSVKISGLKFPTSAPKDPPKTSFNGSTSF